MITDLVLIHGFWSSSATWDRLVARIKDDPKLSGLNVHRFGYPSPKVRLPWLPSRIPDYDDIAQTLPVFFETRISGTAKVAVVTHSQGGLILQRFLAWMLHEGRGRDLSLIRFIVMLACPNEGSEYLRSIRACAGFSMHPQAKDLRVLNARVSEAQRVVLRQIINTRNIDERNCPISFYVYSGASDKVVRRVSAQSIFPRVDTLPGDHFSILDPDAPGSLTFDILREHLLAPNDLVPALGNVCTTPPSARSEGEDTVQVVGGLPESVELLARRTTATNPIFRSAKRVRESRSRVALNVHAAIALPEDAGPNLSTDFPEYVARKIDADLRVWINRHTRTGGLVVLVGDAAAGKTRCLYEALAAEVPDWQMLYVDNGEDINNIVQEGVDLSGTVLWLDELQKFFSDGTVTTGSIRQLLLGDLGPVLLAGTIRAEELEILLAPAKSKDEREAASRHHAHEVVRMLARWSKHGGALERAVRFDVDNHFGKEELASTEKLAALDPRLRAALQEADGGNVTATLAGAPELIARWMGDTGDPFGQAIMTAAVTARRCGYSEPVPITVIEALAVANLATRGKAPVTVEWLQAAINWAESPVDGNIAALRKIVTAPGVIDGYKVSDILLQHSYVETCLIVQALLDNESTWMLLLKHAAPRIHVGIGDAATANGKTRVAEQAWQLAAEDGDVRGMRSLGWFYTDKGRRTEARQWFQQAIDLGDTTAMLGFAFSLRHFKEFTESLHWLRQAAERNDPDAMAALGFELGGMGQVDEAEIWYRRAASFDHALAMTNLGHLLRQRGDAAEAEHWERRAAELGQPGAMEHLAASFKASGQAEEALEWFRKAANRSLSLIKADPSVYVPWPSEAGDEGVSNSVLGLAELLSELGESREAEHWLNEIADVGDARAADMLASLHNERAEPSIALEWRHKAAELAHANLSRNKRELLAAYGEPAVMRHVQIIQNYADYLDSTGDSSASHEWYLRASQHLASGSN